VSPLPPLADIRASNAPAVVILGNDAVLAARPATPVQLAHGCLAAGFRAVIPASWGDELVASATLDALSGRAARPAIHCACPHVARRVLAVGSELAPHLISLVAPPVAAARFLRLNSAGDLRVTYVGRCPAAADDSIDARLTPEELLAQLADRGIDPLSQPEVFESVIPPDRRRHLSVPGGLPSPEELWSHDRWIVETMRSNDFASELAELLLARKDTLIDPAPAVGCVCSGAIRGSASSEARATVIALEPPRSTYPIVDERGTLSLELPLPMAARGVADVVAEPSALDIEARPAGAGASSGDAPPPPPVVPNRRPRLTPPGIAAVAAAPGAAAQPPAPATPVRRRSPTGTPRVVPGAIPVSSDSEGRILPRAYVARRRSPRSGIPVVTEPAAVAGVPNDPVEAAPRATTEPAPRHTVPAVGHGESRAAVDTERPVVRSVEPASTPATVAAAALVPPAVPVAGRARPSDPSPSGAIGASTVAGAAALIGARLGAQLASGAALLRKRSWIVAAGVLAGAGLLLGVAIGYAVAHRSPSPTAAAESEHDADSAESVGSHAAGVRESVSAGGIAPLPDAGRRSASRTQSRPAATPQRSSAPLAGRSPAARPPAPRAAGGAVASAPSPAIATAPAPSAQDSTAIRARRDSIARAESLSAERESIRREIERRRARLDSIERARVRLDSIQRAEQGAGRPPER